MAEYVRTKAGGDGRRYIDLLDLLAMDETQPAKIRIDAARILLSRGFGNPPEEIRVETSPELMRASELREVLKAEGMLTRSPNPAATVLPDLQGWIDGDL